MSDVIAEEKTIPEAVILVVNENEYRVSVLDDSDSFYNISWDNDSDISEVFGSAKIQESLGDALQLAWALTSELAPGVEANIIIHRLGRPFPMEEITPSKELGVTNKVRQILADMVGTVIMSYSPEVMTATILAQKQQKFNDEFFAILQAEGLVIKDLDKADEPVFTDDVIGRVQEIIYKFTHSLIIDYDVKLENLSEGILHALRMMVLAYNIDFIYSNDVPFSIDGEPVRTIEEFIRVTNETINGMAVSDDGKS
jgi:hypothetical protein